jgi:hypothetical protein
MVPESDFLPGGEIRFTPPARGELGRFLERPLARIAAGSVPLLLWLADLEYAAGEPEIAEAYFASSLGMRSAEVELYRQRFEDLGLVSRMILGLFTAMVDPGTEIDDRRVDVVE